MPVAPEVAPRAPKRLSFNERRELDGLPAHIEALEATRRQLGDAIGEPEFYKRPPGEITGTLARLDEVQRELDLAYARWDELDSRVG